MVVGKQRPIGNRIAGEDISLENDLTQAQVRLSERLAVLEPAGHHAAEVRRSTASALTVVDSRDVHLQPDHRILTNLRQNASLLAGQADQLGPELDGNREATKSTNGFRLGTSLANLV